MRRAHAGFTLLEVMIAVVILAIGLSALFTAEAGAVRLGQRARTTTIATLLARCKMGEIEEEVAKKGWPSSTLEERDECCEEADHKGFTCEWKVERIKLPEVDKDKDKDKNKGKGGFGADDKKGSGKPLGVLDKIAELGKGDGKDPMAGVTELLAGGGAGGTSKDSDNEGASALDPIGMLVMEMTFPVMKPVIEEAVRRATVKVKWNEGQREQNLEIVQFLVTEAQIILPDDEDNPNAQTGAPGTSTTGSAVGTTPLPSTSTLGSGLRK